MIVRIGLALCIASAPAYAGTLRVHTDRCASLDAANVEGAVVRELALVPPRSGTADDLVVEIACPDVIHATLRLEPGTLIRDVDLSEEPPALRAKLVALAIAELVETLEVPLPSRPIVDVEIPPMRHVSPEITRDVTVRAGVRVMAWDHVMSTLSADLDVGPVRVGLSAALGHERNGMPYLVEATVARPLACSRGTTAVCLVARGAAGLYGVSIHKNDGDVMDQTLYAGYWDVAMGIEARREIAGLKWIAGIDFGAGDGMIVEHAYLEELDGPFAVATVGTSW